MTCALTQLRQQVCILSIALLALFKESLCQDNSNPPDITRIGPSRHVVPRQYNPGWYPMWDAHYTRNFYVASGTDDISWGRERHTDDEDPNRSARRVWIEAIQDHEGFSQAPTRDEVITCGIGGCEWYTLDPNGGTPFTRNGNSERDGTARNNSVFRHQDYWDWLGRTVTNPGQNGNNIAFGAPNTYRSDHVSTVAVIEQSSHFLTGGTADRGIARFNYRAGNNTYWIMDLPQGNLAGAGTMAVANNLRNVSTDVTDLFLIRPRHWFVICRTRMRYQIGDVTNMQGVSFFDRNALGAGTAIEHEQTGGFGDYIDFESFSARACISHDYTDMITCWELAENNSPIHEKYRTGWRIRSLTGFYESPHFAVCGEKYIKIFNSIESSSPQPITSWNLEHRAIHVEGSAGGDVGGSILSNDFNHQIWDIKYINTRGYTKDGSFLGNGATDPGPLVRPP